MMEGPPNIPTPEQPQDVEICFSYLKNLRERKIITEEEENSLRSLIQNKEAVRVTLMNTEDNQKSFEISARLNDKQRSIKIMEALMRVCDASLYNKNKIVTVSITPNS